MSYKDKYVARNQMYGDGTRETRINNTKRVIEATFKDSPSYYQVLMSTPSTPLDAATPTEMLIDVQIVDNSEVRDEKKLTTLYENNISTGCYFKWMDKYWIMIHYDPMSEIYKRGIVRRCYETLRWLDSNGDVREAWFALRADVSPNFGIDDRSKIIVMPDERRQIIIQKNQYTEEFRKDRRFIFDNRAWKIITLNSLSDNIIDIVLDEDKINPAADNVEMRICDYHENQYYVVINNGDAASIDMSQTLQLSITATRNGIPVGLHEIILSSSNEDIATVDQDGLVTPIAEGSAVISANYGGVVALMNLEVIAVAQNNFTVEITGDNIINPNKTKEYHAEFKNNGYEIIEDSIWSVYADDGVSSTDLVSIVSQDSGICSIKANNNNKYGYFKLHVENLDGTIETDKRVQVKSLL